MTDQKSLIKTATSLKRVEKSVATVDKLLAKSNDELIQLFIRHPDFFLTIIALNYSLSEKLIEKHKSLWDWKMLSHNKSLPWSEKLIDQYQDKWFWDWLSYNEGLPWSYKLIDKYINQLAWDDLSHLSNKNLPWSIKLLDKYKEKWDWDWLSYNKYLPWNEELIARFENKWTWSKFCWNVYLPWTEEFVEKYRHKWDWKALSFNHALPWSKEFIEKYEDKWDWGNLSETLPSPLIEFIIREYEEKVVWNDICLNRNMSWSEEFINKYEEYLDWFLLAENPKLPWTEEFIEKNIEKLDWNPLALNAGLPWSNGFLEKYKNKWDKWDWGDSYLSSIESIPWSISLLLKYEDKWAWDINSEGVNDCLKRNEAVWYKAFKPYVTDKIIEEVIEGIDKSNIILESDNNKAFVGLWKCDKTSMHMSIKFIRGDCIIEAYAYSPDQKFKVSDIKWDGKEIRATFIFPETGQKTESVITQINQDRLKDSYTGDDTGILEWERSPSVFVDIESPIYQGDDD